MPWPRYKRNIRNKGIITKKQKKAIETRLIQISKKLDRYIYKNEKLISTDDAVKYIEEMTVYKGQCVGDARSLQVIEKITRLMNAIINEQEETNAQTDTGAYCPKPVDDTYIQGNDTGTYCPSPVYSVSDIDELNYSQRDSEPLHSNCNETSPVQNEIETIDLSQDNAQSFKVEVEIHRAMSNLSVRDNINETQCSQSILDNIDGNIAIGFSKTSKDSMPYEETENTRVDITVAPPINALDKATVPPVKKKVKFNVEETKPERVKRNIKKMPTDGCKDIRKKNSRKGHKTTPQKSNNKRDIGDKGPMNRSNIGNTVGITANTSNIAYPNGNTIKTSEPLKVPINKTIDVPKIYNKNVVNDLSWVENIRFIREIDMNELEDFENNNVFWDNYTFPTNWDDKDWDI